MRVTMKWLINKFKKFFLMLIYVTRYLQPTVFIHQLLIQHLAKFCGKIIDLDRFEHASFCETRVWYVS